MKTLWLAPLLALLPFPAHAQTVTDRLDKARLEVNTAENALGRALYALDKLREALDAGQIPPEPTPEPTPEDPHTGHEMPPAPEFTPLTVDTLTPIDAIDAASLVKPATIPTSAAPDVVGAFRLTCNMSHLSYNDPIAYPGQPGASHLHMFFGNETADAHSTYESLRAAGDGTCQGEALNRSGYWIPALLDGKGSVVVPDWIVLYYKRAPMGSKFCAPPYAGSCAGIPPGLHAIFGNNYIRGELESPHATFDCGGATKTTSLARTAALCRDEAFIYARISAPDCWDGVNLDSADHQSHLAYQKRDVHSGQMRCPATHPVLIPTLTQTLAFAILPGDDPLRWAFSSDVMAGAEAGTTFHADYMEAWEPSVRLTWEGHCIDKLLNCSDGNLGNGTILPRPAGFTFAQRPHLVPVPGHNLHTNPKEN